MNAATQPPFDLNHAFRTTTATMLARFSGARHLTKHPTTLGDDAERQWRDTLREFLPRRYDVSTAFIIDSHGRESEQIDLVIHDRHFSPAFWTMGDTQFLPAECVYAVFEVKPELTKAYVEYAGHKAASVRRLHRTSGAIQQLAQGPTRPAPKRILAGIVAGRSSWTPGLDGPLVDAMRGLGADEQLDIGCSLSDGMFELPEGAIADDLQRSDADVGLAMFAMRLTARLNAIGTVPALDFDVYSSALTPAAQDPPA